MRTYSINQLRSTTKRLKRVASRMDLNIYQMKYNNLKITREGNAKERLFGLTHPILKNVKTNVGNVFLKLMKKHFPTSHILHKIFIRNNVKISYSCMKNINSIILFHNKNILNPKTASFGCNCWKKESCPQNGECLTSQFVQSNGH